MASLVIVLILRTTLFMTRSLASLLSQVKPASSCKKSNNAKYEFETPAAASMPVLATRPANTATASIDLVPGLFRVVAATCLLSPLLLTLLLCCRR